MVFVIAGPTASGKSDLSIELAKAINGAIVSADSMQIYKGMDIGTAKIAPSLREVPHFGLDIIDPGEPYSASLFQEYARRSFKEIEQAGKQPILCGGTGFYIRAAIDDYKFPKGEQENNPIRDKFNAVLEEKGALELWKILESRDFKSASVIHPNNSKRVIRALELNEIGESYAEQAKALKDIKQAVPALMMCITVDKDILNKRIENRVDRMREEGLLKEVKALLDEGLRDALTSSQAIGYKEIVSAIDGEITLDEAFDLIKTATRRYAKRQRSWFRADSRYHEIDGNSGNVKIMLEQVLQLIDSTGINTCK